ncbi:MAG: winged helix-turn-helix transcriptional regulator [Bacilli bacterium]|jgi:MarR family transcriptional repressor of mepA|nr:winged helix-turn-helix transcriptional regulator [Bacilli bacterium]MCX4253847.1 MarR family winged helix-turn-helix transcriptional regulator [Bacilli bacterium]
MHVLFAIKNFQNTIARNIFNNVKLANCSSPPSMIQAEIIFYLLQNKNQDVYQKDLENVFKIRRSTISGVLKTLEKKGVIKRLDSSNDARVKKIVLTKEAEDLYVLGLEWFNKLEEKATKDIDAYQITIFLEVLQKMQNNLEN